MTHALLLALSLAASSTYPSAVKSHLSAQATPSCTVCHESNAGGFGTVTTGFGAALMDNGLVAGDVDSLDAALDAVEAAGTDSDGDGVGDVDEVRAGDDPNAAGSVGTDADVVAYGFGCGAAGVGVGVPLVLVLLVLVIGGRRRKRAGRIPPVVTSRFRG